MPLNTKKIKNKKKINICQLILKLGRSDMFVELDKLYNRKLTTFVWQPLRGRVKFHDEIT